MTHSHDPRRWHLDDDEVLPSQLRTAISAARTDLPPARVLRAMAVRAAPLLVSSKVAAAVAMAGASKAATHGAVGIASVLVKSAAVGALAGVVAVGGTAAVQSSPHRFPFAWSTTAAPTTQAPRPKSFLATGEVAPGDVRKQPVASGAEIPNVAVAGTADAPAGSEGAQTSSPSGLSRGAPKGSPITKAERAADRQGRIAVPGGSSAGIDLPVNASPAPTSVASVWPETSAMAVGRDVSAIDAMPERRQLLNVDVSHRSASAPSSPVPSKAEAEMLEGARAALEKSPQQAHALADQHRTAYPQGALSQERELIAIDALARLGRLPEARARAAEFRRVFPRSAHIRRIETIVGGSLLVPPNPW